MQIDKKTLAAFGAGMLAFGSIAAVGLQVFAETPHASTTSTVGGASAQDKADNDKGGQDENVALPAGGISEAQARAAIAAAYPNIAIQRIELESNNGTVVYGAKLVDKTEVTVNAITGAVMAEPADQEGVEHHGSYVGKDANEANETHGDKTDKGGADGEQADDASSPAQQ